MNKKSQIKIDITNPEWTADEINRAVQFNDLSESLKKKLRGQRGPNKNPPKRPVSIRLSADVLDAFRATGDGWQTRIDNALRQFIIEHPISASA
jgi:uncharacterized protein (DUF4415 family)